jgi:hypothetical protein
MNLWRNKKMDYMSKLLSLQCPSEVNGDIHTFHIGLHCEEVEIVARKVGEFNYDQEYQPFEILSFEVVK